MSHSTFIGLAHSDFTTHAQTSLERHSEAEDRKSVVAYLQSVLSKDANTIETERTALRSKQKAQRKRQRSVDAMFAGLELDFAARQPELFVTDALSKAEIDARLSADKSETFLTEDYTGDLVISGDDVLVAGKGNKLSARTETLENTITVTGDIRISGSRVVIKDIDFQGVNQSTILFTGD